MSKIITKDELKLVHFPHVSINKKDSLGQNRENHLSSVSSSPSQPDRKIKLNFLYQKSDGSYTTKGPAYDLLEEHVPAQVNHELNPHFNSLNSTTIIRGKINSNDIGPYSSSKAGVIVAHVTKASTNSTSNSATIILKAAPKPKATSNPPAIDLTLALDKLGRSIASYLPPVYDQGGYGTCTANATAYAWIILKLTGGSAGGFASGKYKNTTFTALSDTPSRSSIYYNGRAASGILVASSSSNNSSVSGRIYVDDGTDPSIFASIYVLGNSGPSSVDDTRLYGGYDGQYYYFGGQFYTGFVPNSKWSYPVDASFTTYDNTDPYPYAQAEFLLYNPSNPNGLYDTGLLTPTPSSLSTIETAVASAVTNIESANVAKNGLYSILPSSSNYTMGLSACKRIALPSSTLSNLLSSSLYLTLASGLPVLMTFVVYSNFFNIPSYSPYNSPSSYVMPAPSGVVEGGHCVLIVGWVNYPSNTTNYYFKVQNSWGASWANKGFFYVPLSVLTNRNLQTALYVFNSAK
jgi:hypothetical protein